MNKSHTEMHVLYLPKWYPDKTDTQLGTFNRQLIRHINEHGAIKASVVYLRPVRNKKEAGKHHREENGIHIYTIYYKSCRLPLVGKWLNAYRYRKLMMKAIREIRQKNKISLVHVMGLGRTSWAAMQLKQKYGLPYLITEHWSGWLKESPNKRPALKKHFDKKAAKKAGKLIPVSNVLKQGMQSNGIEGNYEVIPNIVPAQGNAAVGNPPKGNTIMLMVADMADRVKNISGAIEAFGAVCTELPRLEFHLVGGGPDEPRLRQLAGQSPCPERIIFHGRLPHDKTQKAIGDCHFLMVNSRYETFGMVGIEALAAGKPVITAPVGTAPELMDDECGIILKSPGKAQAASAIREMAENHEKYRPGNRFMEKMHTLSPARVTGRYLRIYEEICPKV